MNTPDNRRSGVDRRKTIDPQDLRKRMDNVFYAGLGIGLVVGAAIVGSIAAFLELRHAH